MWQLTVRGYDRWRNACVVVVQPVPDEQYMPAWSRQFHELRAEAQARKHEIVSANIPVQIEWRRIGARTID